MSLRAAILLTLGGVLLGSLLTAYGVEREFDRRLAEAQSQFRASADTAASIAATAQGALDQDSSQGADSIRTIIRTIFTPRTPLPTAPDTCRPWLDRAVALQAALTDAEREMDALDSVQEGRIGVLRDSLGVLATRAARLAVDLDAAAERVPVTRPKTKLLLVGQLRHQAGLSSEAMVGLGTKVSGVELYAGSTWDLGSGDQRVEVGGRLTLPLR